jgi:tRNA U38,U39,U40 pseudouridine synthase TruA
VIKYDIAFSIEKKKEICPEMRYFIEFSYNGSRILVIRFSPNRFLCRRNWKALSTILREPVKTTGAGRTDTGVHAKKMFAHFETNQLLPENLIYKLNSFCQKISRLKEFLKFLMICTPDLMQLTELMNIIFH